MLSLRRAPTSIIANTCWGNSQFRAANLPAAAEHLSRATMAFGYDLNARALLAATLRQAGQKSRKRWHSLTSCCGSIRPTAWPMRSASFLNGDVAAKQELLRLMGDQSQEAIDVATFYADHASLAMRPSMYSRWSKGRTAIPWGTSPLFYYTLAYYQKRAGDVAAVTGIARRRRAPQTKSSIAFPIAGRVKLRWPRRWKPIHTIRWHASISVACSIRSDRPEEAIAQWQAAIADSPADFSTRRALGLAWPSRASRMRPRNNWRRPLRFNPKNHARSMT